MPSLGTVPVISFMNPDPSPGFDDDPSPDLWVAVTAVQMPILKRTYKNGNRHHKIKMKNLKAEGTTREAAVEELQKKLRRAFESLNDPKAGDVAV